MFTKIILVFIILWLLLQREDTQPTYIDAHPSRETSLEDENWNKDELNSSQAAEVVATWTLLTPPSS